MKKIYIDGLGECYDVDCVADCLSMIVGVAIGYDGYNSVDGLKSLIDEMAEYASKAIDFLDEGKIYSE